MNKNIQMECLEEELKFSFNGQLITMKKSDKITLPLEVAKPYCNAGLAKDLGKSVKTGIRKAGVSSVAVKNITQDNI